MTPLVDAATANEQHSFVLHCIGCSSLSYIAVVRLGMHQSRSLEEVLYKFSERMNEIASHSEGI